MILENLFVARDDECVGFKVEVEGRRWAEIVSDLMEHDIGTAIAYAAAGDGAIRTNPAPNERVRARAVFVLVKQGKKVSEDELRRLCAGGGAAAGARR